MLKIDVLYQFGERHAAAAGVSILSLFEHNRHFDEIRVYILGENLSEETEDRFRRMAADYHRTLSFLDQNHVLHILKKLNLPVHRGLYASDLRLYLTYVLDEDIKRLLYLQVNTIINGKLDELVGLDLEGHPVAMALDALVRKHKKQLGFAKDEYYYNAGVILFDMEIWRDQRCSERLVNHIKNVRAWYPLPEQDLLNVVLKGEILKLSPQYSMQPVLQVFSRKDYRRVFSTRGFYSAEELQRADQEPIIFLSSRFSGEFPWNKNNVHPDNDYFDFYLRRSLWDDYIKRPAHRGLVYKIEKILYRRIPRRVFILIFRIAYERSIRIANRDSLKENNRGDFIWDRI